MEVLITVEVDDKNGLGDINKVLIDLSAIFGSESQKMYDNGKFGDQTKYDGVYSISFLVPEGISGGKKTLQVSVQDFAQEAVSENLYINVTAVPEESGDKGFFEENLGVPGFEGNIVIVAFVLMVIIAIGKKRRVKKN